MPDPSIYNVGWICAIKPEYVAAQAFLDEKHERLDHVSTNDSNIYTLGRLGKHNVVIGTLPDGEYGIAAAVSVAKGMLSSFPNVRIGLMVGIGGGAPSLKNDIRLGDIVVSAPRDGHGGVLQYDFGKTVQGKKFQTVGVLNQPPELLRAALADIQTEYEMQGHQLEQAIDMALDQWPRLRKIYQRPDNSSDKLFKCELVHRETEGADCAIDCYNGPSSLVERRERASEEDNPAVHYGTIASANQLMKDAFVRDRLAAEENVFCFEMEAAGLMNRFPCVVIRGICDYSDSHKNKQWRGYAAMAAAAYAKDLLRRIPSNRVEAERAISAVLKSFSADMKSIQFTAVRTQREIRSLHSSLLNANQTMVLNQLRVAEGASFDSYAQEHNRYCLANTRVDLLHQITVWAKDKSAEPTFWLIGMAGTGKSTISRTVAKLFADKGQLGASFFFKRGEADRGNLSKFFMTIAADLIVREPSITPHIEAVLNADRSIRSKNTNEQFQKFLLEPLSKSDIRERPVVLVVDALDECKQDDINHFLYLVSRLETELPDRVRIFMTCRPEEPFRSQFQKIKRTQSRVILHEIPQPVVEHDIDMFLRYELSRIRAEFNSRVATERHLTLDWPGQPSLNRLTNLAVPLFIVAATICRFISDKKIGTPGKLLGMVLSRSSDGLLQLDTTYLSVLDNLTAGLLPSQQEQIIHEFRHVVGSIILLANPLSTSSLAELLGISKDDIDSRLDLLHSVLSIPASAQAPVRLLHLSFRDFLLNSDDLTMPFRVNEKQTHANLAAHCLRMLGCLKKDICNIKFPGTPRYDINIELINSFLPPELQYSCQYWVYHSEEAGNFISDGGDVHIFLQEHFLHWIEALALIDKAPDSLASLRTLRSRCNVRGTHGSIFQFITLVYRLTVLQEKSSSSTSIFLDDAIRFIQTYMSTISLTPLQLYSSLLIFTPKQSKVRTMFEDSEDAAAWICLKPQMEEYWNNCLQTLEGHSDWVTSVVFSPDSVLVASSSTDYTVRIWCADTGECTQTLKGHSDWVTSVVFSPDSVLVASCSKDHTVRIWRADTGECTQTLKGHSDWVTSVVFSPDSTLVVSGSDDYTVRIWRADIGKCAHTLKGHSDKVISIIFSPDSTLVASGSKDHTVRIWRADTGECAQTLKSFRDSVTSVVFSPDSTLIAAGSDDHTVRIYNANTGECTQTLKGHSDRVTSVDFSPDLTLVASGSEDHTVRIWRANTGECAQTLKSFRDSVTSVVFSPDSTLIAAGSDDYTVRVWRADTRECVQTLGGHGGSVSSVVFSPNSTLIASGSEDHTIRIWHTDIREYVQTLEGYRASVTSVVFSPDLTLVASGSVDHNVRIWRADTGKCVQTLEGHSGAVLSVVFSPESMLVASGSDDCAVRIWCVDTGECVRTLEGHRDSVRSVVFSPNSTLIASSSEDNTIRIWRADTDKCVRTLDGRKGTVSCVVFSPDSTFVASGSYNHTVRIWRADTGEFVQTLKGRPGGRARSVVFSPDSTLVASGSVDRTVRVWCANTGKCVQTLRIEHVSNSLQFSQNGSYIITDAGAIAIRGGIPKVTQVSVERSGIGISSNWITWDGRKLLWLPAEFQPYRSSVSESTVVIGSRSGRVIIVGLSPDCSTAC